MKDLVNGKSELAENSYKSQYSKLQINKFSTMKNVMDVS